MMLTRLRQWLIIALAGKNMVILNAHMDGIAVELRGGTRADMIRNNTVMGGDNLCVIRPRREAGQEASA